MRIRLNLATKPLQSHRKFLAGSTVLGTVAALVFLGLGWHVYQSRKANAEMRARFESIERQVVELDAQRTALDQFFSQPENRNLSKRAAFINSLIDARSFNWTLMFMDLERIVPAGVRVVSVEPKQEKGIIEVKFTIGAVNDEAKLKFLKALEESKSFSDIKLVAERKPAQQGGNTDQIVVELTAEYART
jgi:type IV pilus assembly protein PilN